MPESEHISAQDNDTPPVRSKPLHFSKDERINILITLNKVALPLLLIASVAYGISYIERHIWQILAATCIYGILVLLAGVTYRELRRGNIQRALRLLCVGLIVFPWINVVVAGWEWLGGAAGILGLVLVLWLWSPKARSVWWGGLILYLTYIVGLHYLVPFSPYAFKAYSVLSFLDLLFIGGTVGAMLILGGYQLYERWIYRLSIISQFRIAFIAMIVFVSFAVGGTAGWVTYRSGLKQAESQLLVLADFRESEIEAWVEDIHLNLDIEATRPASLSEIRTLLSAPSGTDEYLKAYKALRQRFESVLNARGVFSVFTVIEPSGVILISTDPALEGKNYAAVKYFQEGLKGFYINPWYYTPSSKQMLLVVSRPLVDEDGRVLGVLAAQVNLSRLQSLMKRRVTLGNTDKVYLLAPSHLMLSHSRFVDQENVYVFSEGANAAIEKHQNGIGQYKDYRGRVVVGVYRWLDDINMALLAEQDRSEVLQVSRNMLVLAILIMLISVIVGGLAASAIAKNIGAPLRALADAATRVAAGQWDQILAERRQDEVGTLARAFNRMTAELQAIVSSLEARVAERTKDLEHRSRQLLAAAQVSRQAVLVRDEAQLLDIVVHQISERFGFYHAGVFFIDDQRRYAVLQAASSEGGLRMLSRGHKLRVGEGIVGYVAKTGKPRIALDVGEDAHFFNNPDLPYTRSEMGLPLLGHEQLLGVLDVQSTEPGAFTEADITVLQTMADQVAMAIENTRLLAEAESRLQEVRRLLQIQSREAWEQLMRERSNTGYIYDGVAVHPYDSFPVSLQTSSVELPVEVRQQIVGKVQIKLPEGVTLSEEEWNLARGILAQAGEALESARQFQTMQASLVEADILYRGSRAMAMASSIQDALQVFVDYLVQPGIDRCLFVIIDPETREEAEVWSTISAAWERDNPHPDILGNVWSLSQFPIFKRLFYEAQEDVIVVDDVTSSPILDERSRQMLLRLGVKAALIVPLVVGQHLIGWLLVESLSGPYPFSQREVRLYRGLSDQAALALQGVRLLERANLRANREQLAVELTSRIREPFELDRVLEIAVQELAKALSLDEVVIRLAQEQNQED